jgi:hypothetical protein
MPRSAQPEIAVRLKDYRLAVPEFASVFHWLHREGHLTNEAIAGAFYIKPERVRSIRSRRSDLPESSPLPGALSWEESFLLHTPLIEIPSWELREELGIAPDPDYVVMSRRREEEIAAFAGQIELDQARYAADGRFEDGLLKMRQHIRDLGWPHSALLIRTLARLRHHSAWFLVHMGRTRSATDQARRSMALSSIAYHESDAKIDCRCMAETGLLLANAYLLRQQPRHALDVLKLVLTVKQEFGWEIGPEYHRQMGTAQLQLGEDMAAVQSFRNAAQTMRETGAPEQIVRFWGSRQSSVLNRPDWALAEEVFAATTEGLEKDDLLYQMSVHWAVMTALATEDEVKVDAAFGLFGPPPSAYFGHQATIRHLLEVTPRLRLTGSVLAKWLRYLMYANVFRDE